MYSIFVAILFAIRTSIQFLSYVHGWQVSARFTSHKPWGILSNLSACSFRTFAMWPNGCFEILYSVNTQGWASSMVISFIYRPWRFAQVDFGPNLPPDSDGPRKNTWRSANNLSKVRLRKLCESSFSLWSKLLINLGLAVSHVATPVLSRVVWEARTHRVSSSTRTWQSFAYSGISFSVKCTNFLFPNRILL